MKDKEIIKISEHYVERHLKGMTLQYAIERAIEEYNDDFIAKKIKELQKLIDDSITIGRDELSTIKIVEYRKGLNNAITVLENEG